MVTSGVDAAGGLRGAAAGAAGRAAACGAAASRQGFAGLGGVAAQREELRRLVALPLQSPQLFVQYGIRPPRGVLLHGPPGCGKTVLAAAAAAEAGATLFVLNGSDVVSEAVGESEMGLRGALTPKGCALRAATALSRPARKAPCLFMRTAHGACVP